MIKELQRQDQEATVSFAEFTTKQHSGLEPGWPALTIFEIEDPIPEIGHSDKIVRFNVTEV